jgi:hypothetical protein
MQYRKDGYEFYNPFRDFRVVFLSHLKTLSEIDVFPNDELAEIHKDFPKIAGTTDKAARSLFRMALDTDLGDSVTDYELLWATLLGGVLWRETLRF